MSRTNPGRVLCVAMAVLLALSGMIVQLNMDAPVLGLNRASTGVSAFLSGNVLTLVDLCLVGDPDTDLQSDSDDQDSSRDDCARSIGGTFIAIPVCLAVCLFVLTCYLTFWNCFTAPSWRMIISCIYHTKRVKSC